MTDNNDEPIETCGQHSPAGRRISFQDSRLTQRTIAQSVRDSLRKISNFYDQNTRILTKNFAGAEDNDNEDEKLQSLTDHRKTSMNMTASRYEFVNQRGELSFWATLFTFIKVNIVAGFLFLPNGYKDGGLVFSVIAITFVSIFNVYCNISISDCTEAASTYSFSRIGLKAMGKLGFYLVEFGIAISQICFPCSYANLIAQMTNNLINLWFGTNEIYYLYIGITLFVILVPLIIMRDITKLSSLHLVGDLAVLATVITLIYESVKLISTDKTFNFDHVRLFNHEWAKLLGMAITSMEGIGVILPIKENMREKKKFNSVIIIGNISVSVILCIFPMIMYLCYQDNVNEIVLNNLPLKNVYIQIVLILLMFSIIIVYPVVLYPSFEILAKMCCRPSSENKEKMTIGWKAYMLENLMRIFILGGTILVGILSINKFDTLIALVGCGICTPIAFIFPSIFHFKLFRHKQSRLRSFIDLTACVVGIIVSLVVLIFTLI